MSDSRNDRRSKTFLSCKKLWRLIQTREYRVILRTLDGSLSQSLANKTLTAFPFLLLKIQWKVIFLQIFFYYYCWLHSFVRQAHKLFQQSESFACSKVCSCWGSRNTRKSLRKFSHMAYDTISSTLYFKHESLRSQYEAKWSDDDVYDDDLWNWNSAHDAKKMQLIRALKPTATRYLAKFN